MDFLKIIGIIGCCYFGWGRFVSRFFVTSQRNNPLFWLFLSLITLPLYVSLRSVFGEVPHLEVFIVSIIAFTISFVSLPKYFFLLQDKKKLDLSFIVQIIIVTIFFTGLLLSKYQLIVHPGDTGIWDDRSRVEFLVAMGRSISDPKYSNDISTSYIYHHFDLVIPGVIYNLTQLSAQESMFAHNILEYLGMLWLVLYTGRFLFSTNAARISFTLMATIAGGGFDYFLYRAWSWDSPNGLGLELWHNHLGSFNTRGSHFEMWSQFYTYQWAPHHALSASIVLFLVILLLSRLSSNRYFSAALAGGLVGFSVFVFITGISSLLAGEVLWIISNCAHCAKMKWRRFRSNWPVMLSIPCLSFVFIVFLMPQASKYMLTAHSTASNISGGIIGKSPIIFSLADIPLFFNSYIGAYAPSFIVSFFAQTNEYFRSFFTVAFVYFIDLGIIFLLGISYFIFVQAPKDERNLALHRFILCGFLITTYIIFSYSSRGFNDLFMRGSLVAQMCITIAGAKFIEHIDHKKAWFIIPLLLLFNTTNFFHGLSDEIRFPEAKAQHPIHRYLWYSTPKSSVIYSPDVCFAKDAVFYLNRHCIPMNWEQVKNQYTSKDNLETDAYFLTTENIVDHLLKEVMFDNTYYLYKIETSL